MTKVICTEHIISVRGAIAIHSLFLSKLKSQKDDLFLAIMLTYIFIQ